MCACVWVCGCGSVLVVLLLFLHFSMRKKLLFWCTSQSSCLIIDFLSDLNLEKCLLCIGQAWFSMLWLYLSGMALLGWEDPWGDAQDGLLPNTLILPEMLEKRAWACLGFHTSNLDRGYNDWRTGCDGFSPLFCSFKLKISHYGEVSWETVDWTTLYPHKPRSQPAIWVTRCRSPAACFFKESPIFKSSVNKAFNNISLYTTTQRRLLNRNTNSCKQKTRTGSTLHLKITQHCKSTILRIKIKFKKSGGRANLTLILAQEQSWSSKK